MSNENEGGSIVGSDMDLPHAAISVRFVNEDGDTVAEYFSSGLPLHDIGDTVRLSELEVSEEEMENPNEAEESDTGSDETSYTNKGKFEVVDRNIEYTTVVPEGREGIDAPLITVLYGVTEKDEEDGDGE